MTHEEAQAVKQRTQQAWAKYQASQKPCAAPPFFKTEAERQQYLREVEQAQTRFNTPF